MVEPHGDDSIQVLRKDELSVDNVQSPEYDDDKLKKNKSSQIVELGGHGQRLLTLPMGNMTLATTASLTLCRRDLLERSSQGFKFEPKRSFSREKPKNTVCKI